MNLQRLYWTKNVKPADGGLTVSLKFLSYLNWLGEMTKQMSIIQKGVT